MLTSNRRWALAQLWLGVLAIALVANAETIVSVTGTGGADLLGGTTSQVEFVSWTSTKAFSGVNVSAELGTFDPTASGTAYLMNAIGPGTTTTNQIATGTYAVSSLDPDALLVSLFSGLQLPAGTYYLVVTGPMEGAFSPSSYWRHVFQSPTVVTAPGVSLNDWGFTSSIGSVNFAYPPASDFSIVPSPHLRFTVEVPEPSSMLLLCPGVVALLVLLAATDRVKSAPWPGRTRL